MIGQKLNTPVIIPDNRKTLVTYEDFFPTINNEYLKSLNYKEEDSELDTLERFHVHRLMAKENKKT